MEFWDVYLIYCNEPKTNGRYFKIKICLLGGTELYKNEFQKKISSECLPMENKQFIGVNIGRLNYNYKKEKDFEFNLWNIDCNQNWAFLRTTYYRGAEAIIIFISELKMDQIHHYLSEIKKRMHTITIIFCVLLERFTKQDIVTTYFHEQEFNNIFYSNDIKLEEISEPSKILDLVCSAFLEKRENQGPFDNFIINFIPIRDLIQNGDDFIKHNDICRDYFEPEYNYFGINQEKRINLPLIKRIISKFDDPLLIPYSDHVKIKHERFGTFLLNLKDGKLYLTPKKCEECQNQNCLTLKDAPYYVCIQQENSGWSNVKGIEQPELLIMSKIYAICNDLLPNKVVKRIKKINTCVY